MTLEATIADGRVEVAGEPADVVRLLSWLDRFDFWFNIIAP
jgi:alkyl sulfatase BDS1-like metallo-beta-lactamase superfamily hydrolase